MSIVHDDSPRMLRSYAVTRLSGWPFEAAPGQGWREQSEGWNSAHRLPAPPPAVKIYMRQ